MNQSTSEQATGLLEGLRQSLESDGYGMVVEPAEAGLQITVSANSDTCSDCLVPVGVFKNIVSTMLEKGGLVVDQIDVTYPSSGIH